MDKVQREFFARCAGGFEGVLAQELRDQRIRHVRPLKGGVAFFGDRGDAYRACLWSRTATRIQLVLARVAARDARELYDGVAAFPWEQHVLPGATIAVRAHGENENLRNTQFTALKVKDAICDRLREERGSRPDVDPHDPDFAVDVSLHDARATLYLNLSGESLHRRGYREDGVQSEAPLKETLAAGMLLAAGWRELAAGEDVAFADPMCGSGTLVIEAAQIAAGIAPGMLRNRWGFDGWALHDEATWQELCREAQERADAAARIPRRRIRIVGGDVDSQAVGMARANARRAGVAHLVEFHTVGAANLAACLDVDPGGGLAPRGLMAVNPPYGQRLMADGGLATAYRALAAAVRDLAPNWRLAVVTPDASIDTALGLRPQDVLPCYNGAIEVGVRLYTADPAARQEVELVSLAGVERSVFVAEPNSVQFAARLRKMAKERAKWARRTGVTCYRIYDADLPDYSLSVDLYEAQEPPAGERPSRDEPHFGAAGPYLRIAEYQAPASVDPSLAARRFADALALAPAVLDVDLSHVFSKVRRRDKGGGQYRDAQGKPFVIEAEEGGYAFEVDLGGYLDTGLFLDHRTTRSLVGARAQGARFLNLFAYTGTATVHAAGGGARETTTVDLSQTYLDWARRNMWRNGFRGPQHYFDRADALQWLEHAAQRGWFFDLVFCDPPTFSNSKSKGSGVFDVQRDHVKLLDRIADVLAEDGLIVFSCNLRNFKLDRGGLAAIGLEARDVTAQTIPHDFERNPKIHHCFEVTFAKPPSLSS